MSAVGSERTKAEMARNSRRARRLRAFFAGKIVFRDGSYSFGCVVREFSDSGARIEVPVSRLIPRRFYLLTSKRQLGFDAEVVWRRGLLVGLKFHSTLDLAVSTDPKLRFLRNLSAELCLRSSAESA